MDNIRGRCLATLKFKMTQRYGPECLSENVIFSKKLNINVCEGGIHEFKQKNLIASFSIFLSSGHYCNEELVCRTNADLKKSRHAVCFDIGNNWRRSSYLFSSVPRFKEKLSYFHELLNQNMSKAKEYWKDTLAEEFKTVLSAIFKEGERVLGKG